MELLMGADIGTTAVKAIVIDPFGRIVSEAQCNYSLDIRDNDTVEQDADLWWNALCEVSQECIKNIKPDDRVISLSLSTQGGSLVIADENGEALIPAISWMDSRATAYIDEITKQISSDEVYNKTGWGLSGAMSLAQMIRLRKTNPELFKDIWYVLSTVDYLSLKMTGRAAIDPSNAAMTQFYNINTGDWDKELYSIPGLKKRQLPDIVESGGIVGELTPYAKEAMGLSSDVTLISGGHDQYCGSLGSGAVNHGDVVVSTGTAWVIVGTGSKPVFDEFKCFHPGRHVLPDLWGSIRSIATGGACLEWTRKLMANDQKFEDYSHISKMVEKRDLGSDGVRFFPYLSGSYHPFYSTDNRAAFVGLSLNHDKYHMYRAVMEGLSFELRRYILEYEKLSKCKVGKVILTGGAAKSEVFVNIITDIINLPVIISDGVYAACKGAGILAGIGSGIIKDAAIALPDQASATINKPDLKNAELYSGIYNQFDKMTYELYNMYKV